MFNKLVIIRVLSLLLMLNAFFMCFTLPISYYYEDGDFLALLTSAIITFSVGFVLWFVTQDAEKKLKNRDGYLIVTLGWLVMSLSGCLPYLLSGSIDGFVSAFFETVSGYTTTGSTVLSDVEALPHGVLFWRAMTQWIGGMGIIVLTVAILPLLGVGGMQLFMAESPGPSTSKLHPRITQTAKSLWFIYVGLTLAETVLLMMGNMSFFEALTHSFTTLSSGGFSVKNASIAAYDSPVIQYTIIFFMLLAGTNFTLIYFATSARMDKLTQNEEFRFYAGLVGLATVVCTFVLFFSSDIGLEKSFRDSLFQVASIVTTTGFGTNDYTLWGPFLTMVIFFLMFFGASAGSTAGGLKIVRHVIIVKNGWYELKRLLHPSAVIPVRYNKRAVGQKITFNILAFFFIYLTIFTLGTFIITMYGFDLETAGGASITCLGNIGPGIGQIGPSENFGIFPDSLKLIMCLLMMLGRLELFTVLILFTPFYWSRK